MSRDREVYLHDLLEAADRIREYLADVDRERFLETPLVQDAVLRNLEIIGEAANRIAPDAADAMAGVEWRKIVDMRNTLIHEYAGVDLDIVWNAATVKVPEVASVVREYLERGQL